MGLDVIFEDQTLNIYIKKQVYLSWGPNVCPFKSYPKV